MLEGEAGKKGSSVAEEEKSDGDEDSGIWKAYMLNERHHYNVPYHPALSKHARSIELCTKHLVCADKVLSSKASEKTRKRNRVRTARHGRGDT